MKLILHTFISSGIIMASLLKKTGVKLELLTDNNMLMMIKKGTRGGMRSTVYRHAKANNKYM